MGRQREVVRFDSPVDSFGRGHWETSIIDTELENRAAWHHPEHREVEEGAA